MADQAGAHDRRVVVLAQNAEDDEVGEQEQEHGLDTQHDQQRPGQPHQVQQVHAHQGHAQVDAQGHVAHAVVKAQAELIELELVVQIAHQHREEHGAHIGGDGDLQFKERVEQVADPGDQHGAQGHADEQDGQVLHDVVIVELHRLLLLVVADVHVEGVVVAGGQVIALDQTPAQGAAGEVGHHQAEGGGGQAHQLRAGVAHVLEGIAIRGGAAVAAHQGHRAGDDAVGCVQAHQAAHAHADPRLEDGDDHVDQPVDDKQLAAGDQHPQGGAQTHGGEEGQHEHILQGDVKLELHDPGQGEDQVEYHEQGAADHRGGDAEAGEDRYPVPDGAADQQQNGRQGQRDSAVQRHREQ